MKLGFPPINNYKVMIECCTYNQSQYIEDTLRGFAMQQTNFSFVCCVFDDASIDGEQDVLKRWMNNHCNPAEIDIYDHPLAIILMASDKENQNCIYAIHLQKINTWRKPEKREMIAHWEKQCEYKALCEGDDYWIDPFKLQKQVDFMDKNLEYVLIHTGFQYRANNQTRIFPIDHTKLNTEIIKNNENLIAQILDHNKYRIQTCSVLFRMSLYNNIKQEYRDLIKLFKMGDTPLWVLLLSQGQIYFMAEETTVYRLVDGSASHHTDIIKMLEFNLSASAMRLYFSRKHIIPQYVDKFNSEYIYFLTRYKWFDTSHNPVINPEFDSIYSKIKYYLLTHTPIKHLCRYIYIRRCNNKHDSTNWA